MKVSGSLTIKKATVLSMHQTETNTKATTRIIKGTAKVSSSNLRQENPKNGSI